MRWLALLLFASSLHAITREEIVFRETPQGKLSMTVFYPADWKPSDKRSGIVLFFGGGFVSGDKKQFYSKAGYFASRGMVAASAEYRVKNRHNTTPQAPCETAAPRSIGSPNTRRNKGWIPLGFPQAEARLEVPARWRSRNQLRSFFSIPSSSTPLHRQTCRKQ